MYSFLKFVFGIKCTCFIQFLCPSPGVFHCTHNNGICHTHLLRAPGDGQRNCPKHVESYFKNKFEKLVHLVGFIIRIYHDARSPEHQIYTLLGMLPSASEVEFIHTYFNISALDFFFPLYI